MKYRLRIYDRLSGKTTFIEHTANTSDEAATKARETVKQYCKIMNEQAKEPDLFQSLDFTINEIEVIPD